MIAIAIGMPVSHGHSAELWAMVVSMATAIGTANVDAAEFAPDQRSSYTRTNLKHELNKNVGPECQLVPTGSSCYQLVPTITSWYQLVPAGTSCQLVPAGSIGIDMDMARVIPLPLSRP